MEGQKAAVVPDSPMKTLKKNPKNVNQKKH